MVRPVFFIRLESLMNKKNSWLANLGLLIGGIIIGIVLIEVLGRPFSPVFDSGRIPVDYTKGPGATDVFARDPELGHMPRMGPDRWYSEYGTRKNEYPAKKRPDWQRFVFLGDSITAIGHTETSLKNKLNGRKIEIWNCGVTGYSTGQELIYYRRYCSKLHPDVLILNFFLNDFDGTPVVFKDQKDDYVVVTPYLGSSQFNPWLFRNSVLYRAYLSLKIAIFGRKGLTEDVKKYLVELKNMSQRDGFVLKVVVYPWLDHFQNWSHRHQNQYNDIIRILNELGLPHYDLLPVLEKTLAEGHPVEWTRRNPTDYAHPSEVFSEVIADHLLKEGIIPKE